MLNSEKNFRVEARKVAQQPWAQTILAKDLSSVPCIHIKQLVSAYKLQLHEISALFWPFTAPASMLYTQKL